MPSIDWTLVQYRAIADGVNDQGSCHGEEHDQWEPQRRPCLSKKNETCHSLLQCHVEATVEAATSPRVPKSVIPQLSWSISILPADNLIPSRQPTVIMRQGRSGSDG
jgi:hypothetical protein